MTTAGYSGTPWPKKLGIKEGHAVAVLNDPGHAISLLAPLPAGVRVKFNPRGSGPLDVIIAFVRTEGELKKRFDRGRALLDPAGGLWIAWPKQSHIREYGLSTGLVDNKICAIDADWSGLRFVVRVEDRPPKK